MPWRWIRVKYCRIAHGGMFSTSFFTRDWINCNPDLSAATAQKSFLSQFQSFALVVSTQKSIVNHHHQYGISVSLILSLFFISHSPFETENLLILKHWTVYGLRSNDFIALNIKCQLDSFIPCLFVLTLCYISAQNRISIQSKENSLTCSVSSELCFSNRMFVSFACDQFEKIHR